MDPSWFVNPLISGVDVATPANVGYPAFNGAFRHIHYSPGVGLPWWFHALTRRWSGWHVNTTI